MRPFDEIPLEESDYSDVALLVASAREWPSEDFTRELDARVQRRFALEPPAATAAGAGGGRGGVRAGRVGRGRLPRWAAGPAVALVVGAVAAVVVVSSGALKPSRPPASLSPASLGTDQRERPTVDLHSAQNTTATFDSATSSRSATGSVSTTGAPSTIGSTSSNGASGAASAQKLTAPSATHDESVPYSAQAGTPAPIAPGARQVQSAQISLSTSNVHVDQVAQEVFTVVGTEHGVVKSSHITSATRGSGGGYASFSLSIPTSHLQDAMTQLSRLHYATVASRTDASQNVSHQYSSDQRRLADARALRSSLLKQLQTAYTEADIDSIKAQLKLAESRINHWQSVLGSLQHRIGYSSITVQINSGGLPILPVAKSGGFTIHRAGHDAVRVLVVSAGVALIVLAVLVPVGLVAALLMWLWVWLRQRRREHALDSAG